MLASLPSPELALFEKIVTIAAANFPKLVRYNVDDLLSPLDSVLVDRDRIRLARAYLACVFEKLKVIFECINNMYPAESQTRLAPARSLAWNYLLVFQSRGALDSWPGVLRPVTIPDGPVFQLVPALSHETARPRDIPSRVTVNYFMEALKTYLKIVDPTLAAGQAHDGIRDRSSNLEGPNAYGDDESFPPMMVESNDAVNESTPNPDNSIEYFNFFENNIDHEGHHDHPTPGLIDFLGKDEEQDLESLELSLGMHGPERLKEATLRIREPSPLALSSSHWHDSEPSSHSYDKGKRPMDASGAKDIYPSQQSQGGLDERPVQRKPRLGEASKSLTLW
ncbi:hypothetical protein SeLEV6574_g07119 [Synchytrium endobioticum]|uniref:Uncharacterized protein n=1 Tax=Synchytrium endobioticum TaxID=286115 RepID=A0A507CER8_9FUNG|nr:hypothetical protein SeLEV6574_g07119 [Synchytrium endobioticum]